MKVSEEDIISKLLNKYGFPDIQGEEDNYSLSFNNGKITITQTDIDKYKLINERKQKLININNQLYI